MPVVELLEQGQTSGEGRPTVPWYTEPGRSKTNVTVAYGDDTFFQPIEEQVTKPIKQRRFGLSVFLFFF